MIIIIHLIALVMFAALIGAAREISRVALASRGCETKTKRNAPARGRCYPCPTRIQFLTPRLRVSAVYC